MNSGTEIDQNFFQKLVASQSDTKKICHTLVGDITDGRLSILKLIECIEDTISSEDLTIRRGGVDILTNILTDLPENFLHSEEIANFVNFYCSRLLDHHSFIPFVLKGLLALIKMQRLPDHVSSKIFTTINLNFTCQSQPQADRRLCYQLIQVMMERKPAELQALGPDFVCGYLSIIDSERDPRNLMLLFNNLPFFFKNFSLGHLTEDAFEAVSCYFPIDFQSNPKDPRGISRGDLSNALLPCLTANENFHNYVVDLALEKFSSDLEIAKIDSLVLLKQCFNDFPSNKTSPSSLLIVPVLVDEMKPGKSNPELQQLCADVTAHILKHLYFHNESVVGEKVISVIYSNLETFINDINLSFFLPTVRILAKICASCDTACQLLASKVIQKLFCFSLESKSKILVMLESLDLLLTPCVVLKIDCSNMLGSTWEEVTKVLRDSCEKSEKEILSTAFPVTVNVISQFNKEQRRMFYSQLFKRIKFEMDKDLWKICSDCLRRLAKVYPNELKNIIDSELNTPDYCFSSDIEYEKRIFQFWCVLAPVSGFTSYLDSSVRFHVQYSTSNFVDFVIGSLKNLMVLEKSNKFFLDIIHNEMRLTDYLLNWWHTGNTALPDSNSIFDDEQVAKNLTCIITIIVRMLHEENQMNLSVNSFKLMMDYCRPFTNSFCYLDPKNDLNMPNLHCSLSIISFEAVLNGIHPKILTETVNEILPQVVKYLTTVAIYCSRPFCCIVACRCLATVMNKFLKDSGSKQQIEFLCTSVNSIFLKNEIPLTINAINILFNLAKSLIYRNHADVNRCFDLLFTVLPVHEIHKNLESGFRIFSIEDEYFLNTLSHFIIEPGFRERLFSCAVPKLLESSKNDNKSVKHVCTVSIVYSLIDTSQGIFLNHLKELIPLFISVLTDDEPTDVIVPTLNKINSMLEENPMAFEEYVETFLSRLTSLARNGKLLKIRMAALQCLLQLTKLNPAVILPFKTKISQELLPCLDDKKRLVRREAVKTRSKWIILGSI